MIQSVYRATQIINLFSYSKPTFVIPEISRVLNLSKGTGQALVGTLTHEGFLQQDEETRKYRPGLKRLKSFMRFSDHAEGFQLNRATMQN
jgi:IclR family KDG regulon transcriptional repressor